MTKIKPIQVAIVMFICLGACHLLGCDKNHEHPE